MKLLKWFVIAAVLIYVGWIAMPVAQGLLFPPDSDGAVPSMSSDDIGPQAGMATPSLYEDAPEASQSIQGQTAMTAIEAHNLPVVILWGAVVGLYLISAYLQAHGNIRAVLAYVTAFIADFILTYITKGNGGEGGGLLDKLLDVLSHWDPRYVLTLVAMLLGFLMFMSKDQRLKNLMPSAHD